MNYDPDYGEHAFADAEVDRDLQWLEDMAQYDAEDKDCPICTLNPMFCDKHSK